MASFPLKTINCPRLTPNFMKNNAIRKAANERILRRDVMRSGELVGSWTCDSLSFLFVWNTRLERYILLKTHLNRSSGSKVMSNWRILRTLEKNKKIIQILNLSSGSKVMSNWRILRTIENNRNSFLFLAISHSQYCRLPTDPARSQHIWLHLINPPWIDPDTVKWSLELTNLSWLGIEVQWSIVWLRACVVDML